jgi:hypothetical protein
MPHLLSLPPELRDQILEHVLTHYASPAHDSTPFSSIQTTELHDILYYSPTGASGVSYALPLPQTSPFALMRVNRQLRTETIATVRRLLFGAGLRPARAAMEATTTCCDVLVVDEDRIVVTWTYVPPLLAVHPAFYHINEAGDNSNSSDDNGEQHPLPLPSTFGVRFTIRPHGIFHPTPTTPRSGYEDCSNEAGDVVGPGRLITGLCALFERFIRVGPEALPLPERWSVAAADVHHPNWRRRDDRGQIVHCAELSVQYPTGGVGLLPERLGAHYARDLRVENRERCNSMIHPRSLASMLVSWYEASQWIGEDLGGHQADDGQEAERNDLDVVSAPIDWSALIRRVKEVRIGVEGEKQEIFT